MVAPPTPRYAREVIDEAIRENSSWDTICKVLVAVFAAAGAVGIIAGLIRDNGLVALSGSISAIMCWPALRYADPIRRTNMAIRLLEVPLSQAKTAAQAVDAIKQVYLLNTDKKGKNNVVPSA